jgi:SAM-dependent methyltransferase
VIQPDVTALLDFYARPLGGVVRRILSQRIRARWRQVNGATLMGLGFATPYLGAFRGEAARLGALMPAGQGAVIWPAQGPVHTVSVEDGQLPLPDNSVDYLLAVHCLETAEHARGLLRELWRVLKPDGRLLVIVPNRRGVWARLDTTPFGHGLPYSQPQLERLLTNALLTPIDWSSALFIPPIDRRIVLRSAMPLERFGARVSPAIAGVIVVEAKKELMAPIGTAAATRRLREMVPGRTAAFEAANADALDDQRR